MKLSRFSPPPKSSPNKDTEDLGGGGKGVFLSPSPQIKGFASPQFKATEGKMTPEGPLEAPPSLLVQNEA